MTEAEAVVHELKVRMRSLMKWRACGRGGHSARHRSIFWIEFRHWRDGLDGAAPAVLRWGADELFASGEEYLRRDYNAYYTRLRRLEGALDRWERLDVCPIDEPSRYERTARAARAAAEGDES